MRIQNDEHLNQLLQVEYNRRTSNPRTVYGELRTEDNVTAYYTYHEYSALFSLSITTDTGTKVNNNLKFHRYNGYQPTIGKFMEIMDFSDIFLLSATVPKRKNMEDFGLFNKLFDVKMIKKSHFGKITYVKYSSIMGNLFGLRNGGRFELPNAFRPISDVRLTTIPDIFVLSLLKSKDGNIFRIGEDEKTPNRKQTKFKFNPKDFVLLVNGDKVQNKAFMRDNYSSFHRGDILRNLYYFGVMYESMFGFKPEIHFVNEKEIFNYVEITTEPDTINSLMEIQRIDKKVKELVHYDIQQSKYQRF